MANKVVLAAVAATAGAYALYESQKDVAVKVDEEGTEGGDSPKRLREEA